MTVRVYSELCTDELGQKSLELARADLGLAETAPNWSPEIKSWLAFVGISSPAPWCAAWLSVIVDLAEVECAVKGPTKATSLAKGFMRQLVREGRWIDREKLRAGAVLLRPGWIYVLDRATKGAPWRGHVGLVHESTEADPNFQGIDGNAGPRYDRVALMRRSTFAPDFLGAGILSGPMPC